MNFFPSNGNSLIAWTTQLSSIAGASPSTYGLVSGDLTALNSLLTQFTTNYGLAESLELQRKAAVLASNASKQELIDKIRSINNKAQASSASASAKAEAGLPVHDTSPTKIIPQEIKEISANGFESGVNKIKWARSGNKATVKFRLESSADGIAWFEVATVTSTRFSHTNQIPGATQWYRVFAFNQNGTAPASPVAVVYPNSEGETLRIAA